MRIRLLFVSVLLLTLFVTLTACGGSAASPTATSAPAATPVPVEPTAPALPTLDQTVTSENGVSVSYPSGWLDPVATIGIFLYNNADGQATMNFMRARVGGMAFQINMQPNSSERTPDELFDFTFNGLITGLSITPAAKETITLDGVEIIKSVSANTTAGSEIALYTALKPVEDGFVTFIVYLHPNDVEAQTPLIEAMLASSDYNRP
ncbi:MAG: hypothetical protein IAE80_28765 [Anaerolinea sp.]|nr:hypothetical protein [Anaerolinea sp.]